MVGYDVSIETLSICGFLDIRGGADVRQACSKTLGIVLPATANTLSSNGIDCSAYCVSSDHWLLQVADESQQDVLHSLEQSNEQFSHSFVDVSDMYVRIQLSGRESRKVLAQGLSIDIHPRVFPPGSTARTGLAKTTAQLHYVDESHGFVIIVRRSYERHVRDWLTMAAGKS